LVAWIGAAALWEKPFWAGKRLGKALSTYASKKACLKGGLFWFGSTIQQTYRYWGYVRWTGVLHPTSPFQPFEFNLSATDLDGLSLMSPRAGLSKYMRRCKAFRINSGWYLDAPAVLARGFSSSHLLQALR